MRPVLENMQPSEVYTWSKNMAFGAIPFDIIDCIRSNSDDLFIKLRCMLDLERVLDGLKDPANESDLKLL